MDFDILSDLHLHSKHHAENYIPTLKPGSSTLVVAGDAGQGCAKDTLVELTKIYDKVLFVDGNHEHYLTGKKIAEVEKMHRGIDKVHYLYGDPYVVDNVAFVGCNGWYMLDYPLSDTFFKWQKKMNDYRCIHEFNNHLGDLHKRILALGIEHMTMLARDINNVCFFGVSKIVVVTHTAPRHELLVGIDHPFYDLNGAFYNMAMRDIYEDERFKEKIKVWNYGHTHFNADRTIDGIRYVNNARGYDRENPDHKGIMTISV